MKKDWHDLLLKDPNTQILITMESVYFLWENRYNLTPKNKKHRFPVLYESLSEIINNLNNGKIYAENNMKDTTYWKYITAYHKSWMQKPLTEKAYTGILNKFYDVINLFNDIKEHGIKNPLDMIVTNSNRIIYKGVRRLIIANVLNIPFVKVRNAIIYNNSSS